MAEGIITRRGSSSQRFYLYKDGDEITSLTGGWTGGGTRFTKETNYLQYELASGTPGLENFVFSTTNNIDLTPYSKLCMEVEIALTTIVGSNPTSLNVQHEHGSTIFQGLFVRSSITRTSIHCDDVSAITASSPVRVRAYNFNQIGTIRISKIWVER